MEGVTQEEYLYYKRLFNYLRPSFRRWTKNMKERDKRFSIHVHFSETFNKSKRIIFKSLSTAKKYLKKTGCNEEKVENGFRVIKNVDTDTNFIIIIVVSYFGKLLIFEEHFEEHEQLEQINMDDNLLMKEISIENDKRISHQATHVIRERYDFIIKYITENKNNKDIIVTIINDVNSQRLFVSLFTKNKIEKFLIKSIVHSERIQKLKTFIDMTKRYIPLFICEKLEIYILLIEKIGTKLSLVNIGEDEDNPFIAFKVF